jgi:hypothetical protein
LLISNVLVYFSVLVCCRVVQSKCGLKGRIEPRSVKSLLVRSITQELRSHEQSQDKRAYARTREAAIERLCNRAHEQRSSTPHVDRVSHVTLAAIASCLRRGIPRAVMRA